MHLSQFVNPALFTITAIASFGIISLSVDGPVFAADAPHIQVELAQPVDGRTSIIRGTAVRCRGTSCVASRANSSAKNMCVKIAREFGEITAFRMGKRELDDAALAKCNSDTRAQHRRSAPS